MYIKNCCFMEDCGCDKSENRPLKVDSPFIEEPPRQKVRKEVHTRKIFAYQEAERWLSKIIHNQRASGNIISGKSTHKFLQARRIYVHYTNEAQKNQNLPLSK